MATDFSIPVPIPGLQNLQIPIPDPFTGVDNWFKNIGGQIASGLEGGFVAVVRDIWNVIIGPLEIAGGILVAILVIVYMFRDDLASLAPIIGAMAL